MVKTSSHPDHIYEELRPRRGLLQRSNQRHNRNRSHHRSHRHSEPEPSTSSSRCSRASCLYEPNSRHLRRRQQEEEIIRIHKLESRRRQEQIREENQRQEELRQEEEQTRIEAEQRRRIEDERRRREIRDRETIRLAAEQMAALEQEEEYDKMKNGIRARICRAGKCVTGIFIVAGLVMVFYVIVLTILGEKSPLDLFNLNDPPEIILRNHINVPSSGSTNHPSNNTETIDVNGKSLSYINSNQGLNHTYINDIMKISHNNNLVSLNDTNPKKIETTSNKNSSMISDENYIINQNETNYSKTAEARSYIAYIPVPLNNEEEEDVEGEEDESQKEPEERPSSFEKRTRLSNQNPDPVFVPVMILPEKEPQIHHAVRPSRNMILPTRYSTRNGIPPIRRTTIPISNSPYKRRNQYQTPRYNLPRPPIDRVSTQSTYSQIKRFQNRVMSPNRNNYRNNLNSQRNNHFYEPEILDQDVHPSSDRNVYTSNDNYKNDVYNSLFKILNQNEEQKSTLTERQLNMPRDQIIGSSNLNRYTRVQSNGNNNRPLLPRGTSPNRIRSSFPRQRQPYFRRRIPPMGRMSQPFRRPPLRYPPLRNHPHFPFRRRVPTSASLNFPRHRPPPEFQYPKTATGIQDIIKYQNQNRMSTRNLGRNNLPTNRHNRNDEFTIGNQNHVIGNDPFGNSQSDINMNTDYIFNDDGQEFSNNRHKSQLFDSPNVGINFDSNKYSLSNGHSLGKDEYIHSNNGNFNNGNNLRNRPNNSGNLYLSDILSQLSNKPPDQNSYDTYSTKKSNPFNIMLDIYPMPDNNRRHLNDNSLETRLSYGGNPLGPQVTNAFNLGQRRNDQSDANQHKIVLHLNLFSHKPSEQSGHAMGRSGTSLEIPITGKLHPADIYKAMVSKVRHMDAPYAQPFTQVYRDDDSANSRDDVQIELFELEEGPKLMEAIEHGLQDLNPFLPDDLKFNLTHKVSTDDLHETMNEHTFISSINSTDLFSNNNSTENEYEYYYYYDYDVDNYLYDDIEKIDNNNFTKYGVDIDRSDDAPPIFNSATTAMPELLPTPC